MLLAIDVGNTQVNIGIWDGQAWLHEWRLRTIRERTSDEYGILLMTLLQEAFERCAKDSNNKTPVSNADAIRVSKWNTKRYSQHQAINPTEQNGD